MTGKQQKSHNSISENKACNSSKKMRKETINLNPCHLKLSPQLAAAQSRSKRDEDGSSALSPMLFAQSSALSTQSSSAKQLDFTQICTDLLRSGNRVRFRAPGYSMYPTILHEDVITVEPIKPEAIKVGDIVLYRNQNSVIAHRVVRIENKSNIHTDSQSSVLSTQSFFILRGDARPADDDPVDAEQILGKVVSFERKGRCMNPYCLKARFIFHARRLASRLKRVLS